MTRPYESDWEYLCEEFRRLDLMIYRQILRHGSAEESAQAEVDQIRGTVGLVSTSQQILTYLRQHIGYSSTAVKDSKGATALAGSVREKSGEIEERLQATREAGRLLSLPTLQTVFRLNDFERHCLIAGLAPSPRLLAIHAPHKFGEQFAYLQRNAACRLPLINTLVRLFADGDEAAGEDFQTAFDRSGKLARYRLLEVLEAPEPILDRVVRVDDWMAEFMLGSGICGVDQRLEESVELLDHPRLSGAPADLSERVAAFVDDSVSNGKQLLVQLTGQRGSSKQCLASAAVRAVKFPLLVVDCARLVSGNVSPIDAIWLLGREALLRPAAIYLSNWDRAMDEVSHREAFLEELISAIESLCHLVFIDSERSVRLPRRPSNVRCVHIAVPAPDLSQRRDLWQWQYQHKTIRWDANCKPIDASELASKFRFTANQIDSAIQRANDNALWISPTDQTVKPDDLIAACRAESNQMLSTYARKIEPVYAADDLVLPAKQKRLLGLIQSRLKHRLTVYSKWGFAKKQSYGSGLSALFSGSSGTGKTMAAETIAKGLRLDLYKIDLSQVVSKYIGETEKNLKKIFEEAETSNAILFIDEADALCGKRSEVRDSHDRYANIEVAFLLQEMERYEGLCILATNLRQNLDDAFMRRLKFIVEFPFPSMECRRDIWQRTFPKDTPLGKIDFDYLARTFELAGGNIKNVIEGAAFLAASEEGKEAKDRKVRMEHIFDAAKQEYTKLGRIVRASDFETSQLMQTAIAH